MRLLEVRRVSTAEQATDDRAGLLRQEAENRKTAASVGGEIVRTFVIVDVSRASVRDTSEWREISRLIEAPDVHIVVDRQDRLIAGLEGMQILEILRRTNTKIYTGAGNVDANVFGDTILAAIQALQSGDELRTIRHRTQGAKEALRKRGEWPNGAETLPIGIGYEKGTRKVRGRWFLTDEISRVQELFQLFAVEGIDNYSELGRRLGFGRTQVPRILVNQIYVGVSVAEMRRNKISETTEDGRRRRGKRALKAPGEIYRVEVFRPRGKAQEPGDTRAEAAITPELWEAAQAAVEARKGDTFALRDQQANSRFAYTGLLRCAKCGKRMVSKTVRMGKKARRTWRYYYVCSTATQAGGCRGGFLRREKTEAALDHLFSRIVTDPRFIDAVVGVKERRDAPRVQAVTRAKAETAKLEGRRAKLLDLYLQDSGFTQSELDARRIKLDSSIEAARREVAKLEQAQALGAESGAVEAMRALFESLQEFEFWSRDQQRVVIARIFRKIAVSPQGVEVLAVQLPVEGHGVGVDGHIYPHEVKISLPWEQLQEGAALLTDGVRVAAPAV